MSFQSDTTYFSDQRTLGNTDHLPRVPPALANLINRISEWTQHYGRLYGSLVNALRRRLLTVRCLLCLSWLYLLHWGERSSFKDSINACDWERWEQWPSGAQPHHVVLLADPQLVDPHTYPGRPWPLSDLTIAFTDKYMRRSYRLLQHQLDPDTLLFLGDLFDGGREWSTLEGGFEASEAQWNSFGENFWLREYNRFGELFFDPLQVSGGLPYHKQRRIIASLPGNHDLGFGRGVQPVVRKRFQAYFGEGDRVDVIGNHTFVSLDTVSLSAMDQPDSNETIWQPTMDFLDQVKSSTERAVEHELLRRHNQELYRKYDHHVTTANATENTRLPAKGEAAQQPKSELPTILLTHVPFYREPGTPCGPLRERHPPTALGMEIDEPNAIMVARGFQYQNVLTREISKTIADKIGNLARIFSGDDHDYCEVVHRAYPSAGGGIREITVKSMSWAMGIRKPGFLLASLWNPIDEEGESLPNSAGVGQDTVQTHLCLLPDQLGIFIRYGVCLGLTITLLVAHSLIAAGRKQDRPATSSTSYLPVDEPGKQSQGRNGAKSRDESASANSAALEEGPGLLSARSHNSRARSVSPGPDTLGGYGVPSSNGRASAPLIEQAGFYGDGDTDEWGYPTEKAPNRRPRKSYRWRVLEQLGRSTFLVAVPAITWYWWLMSHG